MTRTWRDVWESKTVEPGKGSALAGLMAANGYDTAFGSLPEHAFRKYVFDTAAAVGIGPESSVFEVGCGAGAFLYELHQRGCKVAGIDASSALIRCAREAMPQGHWELADAAEFDTSTAYDFAVANGVFLYFPSLDYSLAVLQRMACIARRGLLVLDVPDAALRHEAMAARRRALGDEAYEQRYTGLDHLYFDRAWFAGALPPLGFPKVRIADQKIAGYANAPWRFNVVGQAIVPAAAFPGGAKA